MINETGIFYLHAVDVIVKMYLNIPYMDPMGKEPRKIKLNRLILRPLW